jgi:hypothetical protein
MESQDQNIRRVFEEGFCARDIAQTLRSFDAETPVERAAAVMQYSGCVVAGVRTQGIVSGYLHIDALSGDCCGDCQQSFAAGQLASAVLPLAEVVMRLKTHPFCFVVAWEQPCGFVGKSDLQKPPGRMWLFGMVTLIETRFGRLIEAHCTDDEWMACLSPGRIEKAETLRQERLKLGQQIKLADCLQFADKAQIFARTEKLRLMTRYDSKRQIEDIGRKLEKLRNNLAHSQEIIAGDWGTIVALAENVSSILDGPVQRGNVDD